MGNRRYKLVHVCSPVFWHYPFAKDHGSPLITLSLVEKGAGDTLEKKLCLAFRPMKKGRVVFLYLFLTTFTSK